MFRKWLFSFLSVPAFGLLYIYMALGVLVLIPILLLGLRKLGLRMMEGWSKSMFYIIGRRLHYHGLENIDKNGRYIVVANHSSLFDILAIISIFPGLSWFGHERLTKVPVFKHILKLINYVPMRKATIASTKQMMGQLVENSQGHTIGIFPEGTRSLDGRLNDFYRGFVILLRNANIDVLPVTLKGFFSLKPKNRFYIGFDTKLDVIVHQPIARINLLDKSDIEIISKIGRASCRERV